MPQGEAGLGLGVTRGCEAPWQQAPVSALAPLTAPALAVQLRGGLSSPERLSPSQPLLALRARPTLGRLRKQPGEQIRAGARPDGGCAKIYTGAFSGHCQPGTPACRTRLPASCCRLGELSPSRCPPAPGAGEEVICGCPGQAAASSAWLRHARPCLLGRHPVTKRQGWDLPFCCWLSPHPILVGAPAPSDSSSPISSLDPALPCPSQSRWRIGSSSALPRRLLPALPSERSVGRSGVGCCLQDAGSVHGKTCKVLSLIRLLDLLLRGAKYLLWQARLPFTEHPRLPCKRAGHDGTRRGDAASSKHRGREPRRRRGGSVHGRWRRGHRGKVKQGCKKAVDFGIALSREEVPVARPRLCTLLVLPPWPRVALEALPAALARPALPIWAVPARIRLLAGEGCYLPSNLFGGFSGEGTSAGRECGGTEARWAGTGPGDGSEAQSGVGVVLPPSAVLGPPLWAAARPSPGVHDNTRNRRRGMSPLGLPVGHARGSSEVRAESAVAQPRCTTRCAPAMMAAVAGGSRPGRLRDGSPPSGVSPCAGSFAVARWLAGAMQDSFLHYDLVEETDPSLFSHLKLILFLPLRGIVFESRASSADRVVFICFAEMFSWPKQQPPSEAKGRLQPLSWRRGAA